MKIAFISSDNNASSGAFISMINLARQLNNMDVSTLLILPVEGGFVGPGDGQALTERYGLSCRVLQSVTWVVPPEYEQSAAHDKEQFMYYLQNRKAAHELKKILIEEKVDIVHINTSYSYYSIYAANAAHIPCVWHIREFLEEDQNVRIYNRKGGYELMKRATVLVAISKSIFAKYAPIFGENHMCMIYNGIDTNTFYNPDRKVLEEPVVKFSYIGGMSEGKGVNDLLAACNILNNRGYKDKYTLTLAGRGTDEYNAFIQQYIDEYSMSNLSYIGYTNEVRKKMEEADVSLITSKAEAFGRVTVEAMMTGNLVLGANTAGTKELLNDGKLGLMFECGNPVDIADKMIDIMENRESYQDLAEKGRSFMATHMTAKRNAESIKRLYDRILEKKDKKNKKK